jgi:hypothetical protein
VHHTGWQASLVQVANFPSSTDHVGMGKSLVINSNIAKLREEIHQKILQKGIISIIENFPILLIESPPECFKK